MKHCFERYCKDYENIENFEKAKADNFKGWHCHHRLETHNSDGERRLVDIAKKELKALGMYHHRPASELIFLTTSEHQFLHQKGKKRSDEAKKKIGAASKGNTYVRGRHWFNNGKISKRAKECPEGFVPGRIKKP